MDIIVKKPTAAEKKLAQTWPIWEKEPSSFVWTYDEQETCLILEGRAVVSADGKKFPFKAGDYVVFPKGLSCTWEIEKAIKKHYRFG